jgi:hypothetical protein
MQQEVPDSTVEHLEAQGSTGHPSSETGVGPQVAISPVSGRDPAQHQRRRSTIAVQFPVAPFFFDGGASPSHRLGEAEGTRFIA